jgi:hypothetical protein
MNPKILTRLFYRSIKKPSKDTIAQWMDTDIALLAVPYWCTLMTTRRSFVTAVPFLLSIYVTSLLTWKPGTASTDPRQLCDEKLSEKTGIASTPTVKFNITRMARNMDPRTTLFPNEDDPRQQVRAKLACPSLRPGLQGNDEPRILRRDVSARKRRRHPSRNGLVAV